MQFSERGLQQGNFFRYVFRLTFPAVREQLQGVAQPFCQDTHLMKLFDLKRKIEMMARIAQFLNPGQNNLASYVTKRNRFMNQFWRRLWHRDYLQSLKPRLKFLAKVIDNRRLDRCAELFTNVFAPLAMFVSDDLNSIRCLPFRLGL